MIEHERLEEKLDELIALVSSEVVPTVESKLKLYVWNRYCPDYTDGLAFVIARNLNEAQNAIGEMGCLECAGKVKEYEIAPICFECGGGS